MYDGRWAHMKSDSNTIEILEKGIIPTSETGWELENYGYSVKLTGSINVTEYYNNEFFFDSNVCVYIVTLE